MHAYVDKKDKSTQHTVNLDVLQVKPSQMFTLVSSFKMIAKHYFQWGLYI